MATLSARALCTVEDVKPLVHQGNDELEDDDVLIPAINAAAAAIHRISGREFKRDGVASQMREFDLVPLTDRPAGSDLSLCRPWDLPRTLRIGDLADPPTLVELHRDGELVETVAAAEVFTLPRPRLPSQPITRLWFADSVSLSLEMTVKVTGKYGWPSVPEDIVTACALTAASWFGQDAQRWSETFAEEENRASLRRALPQRAYDIVIGYRLGP